MKKIKIPNGWRKLRKGTVIKAGDKYLSHYGEWALTAAAGRQIGAKYFAYSPPLAYIRRIKRRKK